MSTPLQSLAGGIAELLRALDEGRYRFDEVHVRADLNYLRAEAERALSGGGGDGPCQDCGRPYPAWFAPHEVWNLVMGGPIATDDPGGLLCPTCFLIRADREGVRPPAWRIFPPASGLDRGADAPTRTRPELGEADA